MEKHKHILSFLFLVVLSLQVFAFSSLDFKTLPKQDFVEKLRNNFKENIAIESNLFKELSENENLIKSSNAPEMLALR